MGTADKEEVGVAEGSLGGRVALVTGASGGIGQALVQRLAAFGVVA